MRGVRKEDGDRGLVRLLREFLMSRFSEETMKAMLWAGGVMFALGGVMGSCL